MSATDHYSLNYRILLPENRNARILDLGCGEGDFIRFAHGLGFRKLTGVDRDQDVIRALGDLEGVTPIHADVTPEFLTRLGGGCDLIVAKQMIYYFDRKEAPGLVQKIAHSLADNGRLIVEIFNGALLSSRFTELKDPAILTAYTEQGLKRLLDRNGLVVERLVGAKAGERRLRSRAYQLARRAWFRTYRRLLIIERGFDDELPAIGDKAIIAVARRA